MGEVFTVVVPVYNEEAVLNVCYERLTRVMEGMGEPYALLFVDDGSRDKTPVLLKELQEKDQRVQFLRFSRNFGHQAAITAGMDMAAGEAIIIIDADLQDPPEVIPEMAKLWRQGFEVVYGQRISRKGESTFKKMTAALFYRFLKHMTSVDIPVDTGDFRLIDRKVCDAMKSLHERGRYVRGLVSWVGFKQTAYAYKRDERLAGETKYPLNKMLKLALDGITAFSYKPLRLATYFGSFISAGSFIFLIVVLFQKLAGQTVTGWASTMAAVLFTQGIVLMMLGLMGEYVGRIFEEIKSRPIYIISEAVGFKPESK